MAGTRSGHVCNFSEVIEVSLSTYHIFRQLEKSAIFM